MRSMSPYEVLTERRLEQRLARLRPQVAEALSRLAAAGVRARVVGSYARNEFRPHSDVDFLIEEPGQATMGQVYEAIAGVVKDAPFDIVYLDWLSDSGRAIMLENL